MSLKHRGGSKYSKKQMLYAKYDDQVRFYLILSEILSLNIHNNGGGQDGNICINCTCIQFVCFMFLGKTASAGHVA